MFGQVGVAGGGGVVFSGGPGLQQASSLLFEDL